MQDKKPKCSEEGHIKFHASWCTESDAGEIVRAKTNYPSIFIPWY